MRGINKLSEFYQMNTVHKSMYDAIQNGLYGQNIINIIYNNNQFIPKESDLWDYKQNLENNEISLCKLVKQVASFHNSYGGYIFYGIAEIEKDKKFELIKPELFSTISVAQIRNYLQNYLNEQIDITYTEEEIICNEEKYKIGILYIPKRKCNTLPVRVKKQYKTKDQEKKIILECEDVFFRRLDECKKASNSDHWQFLFSERSLDHNANSSANVVDHNLPDKNSICPSFIGRQEVLSQLWEWLSDQFEYTKVLAGDGGKGKTSIAYNFCQQFIKQPPIGFERVLWLSAKEKQFSGIQNDYYNLKDADFVDYNSFLYVLSENNALDFTHDDFSVTSIKSIKRDISDALELFPSLIIVDNVDSLVPSEQLKVIETCRQLGKKYNRFLITTRNKVSFSDDLCINIAGLDKSDFEKYIDLLLKKYVHISLNKNQIDLLYNNTDGSPLLAQSIIRLCRLEPFNKALDNWKGKAGEDARKVALEREINNLGFDAKRVLLCIHYYGSCSKTELQQVSAMHNLQLDDALTELLSLFLIEAPKFIETEERFSVSNTTHLLINSLESTLASDYVSIKQNIQAKRKGIIKGKQGNSKRVGLVISQALALLTEKRYEEAIQSIKNELKRQLHNPDLLLALARCMIADPEKQNKKILDVLKEAYKYGQRKEMLFDYWFDTENSPVGKIEIANLALKQLDNAPKWKYNLALSFTSRANIRTGIDKVNDLMDASKLLSEIIKDNKYTQKGIKDECCAIHDYIWKFLQNDESINWKESSEIMMNIITQGDFRTSVLKNTRYSILQCEENYGENDKYLEHLKFNYNKIIRKTKNEINSTLLF